MGNRIYIDVVTETPRGETEGDQLIKVFDDYDSTSIYIMDELPTEPKEFFFVVLRNADEVITDMLDFARLNEKPLHIDGAFVEFEEWGPWREEYLLMRIKEAEG